MRSRLITLSFAVLAGILLGIGSRVPYLWELSLISFLPLMAALSRVGSARARLLVALATGLVAYGLSFHALFWDSLPLTWLGISGPIGVLLIGIIWGTTALLYAGAFACLLTVATRHDVLHGWRALLAVPSAYVLADWLAAWGFSLINYGQGALLGPNFTMGSPAYQLAADGALLQLASWGSVYALGFAQAMIGVVLYRLLVAGKRERAALAVLAAVLFASWAAASWWFATESAAASGVPVHVALLTRYEPAVLVPSDAALAASFQATAQSIENIATGTDVVVLPEDTRFLLMWHALDRKGTAPPLPKGVIILDSASEYESDGLLYSRLEEYDTTPKQATYAYKLYLMPFGEYLPYFYQALARAIGQGAIVDTLSGVRSFHIREQPIAASAIDGAASIAMLCSEAMSPYLYADGARAGATVFYNLASHSWFHGSRMLYALALWTGRVRAVESHRWYARAADGTPSFILDPYGRITAESAWDVPGITYGTVYPRTDRTLYMGLGQWVLLVPLFILVTFAVRVRLVRRTRTA